MFRKGILTIIVFGLSYTLIAQQALNNDSIIKLVKAGLSENLIVSTINASPGTYDTSADGIIALKQDGASDKVVSAIVAKASSGQPRMDETAASPSLSGQTPTTTPVPSAQGDVQKPAVAVQLPDKPRVFLTSASKGTNQNAARDQSMEMSKDFERDCPAVRITINQNVADYTVSLNHIEIGLLVRDNQFQIANKDGDLISKTKEGGIISGGVKKACQTILTDWTKK